MITQMSHKLMKRCHGHYGRFCSSTLFYTSKEVMMQTNNVFPEIIIHSQTIQVLQHIIFKHVSASVEMTPMPRASILPPARASQSHIEQTLWFC